MGGRKKPVQNAHTVHEQRPAVLDHLSERQGPAGREERPQFQAVVRHRQIRVE